MKSLKQTPHMTLPVYRLHQEEKLFSNGVFQKGVLVSSALSLAVQFAVYSCMVFRIIRTYRRNKAAALRTALRKSAKRPETRPLVHTGQVALNSVYVPPKTKWFLLWIKPGILPYTRHHSSSISFHLSPLLILLTTVTKISFVFFPRSNHRSWLHRWTMVP